MFIQGQQICKCAERKIFFVKSCQTSSLFEYRVQSVDTVGLSLGILMLYELHNRQFIA